MPCKTRAATAARMANAARRAAADPKRLAQAVRIVRAALAEGRITLADLTQARAARERGGRGV